MGHRSQEATPAAAAATPGRQRALKLLGRCCVVGAPSLGHLGLSLVPGRPPPTADHHHTTPHTHHPIQTCTHPMVHTCNRQQPHPTPSPPHPSPPPSLPTPHPTPLLQLFDRIRLLGPEHELAALLDEFTFTSMISNCVGQQDLQRALALMEASIPALSVQDCSRSIVHVLLSVCSSLNRPRPGI